MIKIGMLIGSRYEILEKIGTGGMSDVYKAKCHKLNRFVAMKVLKQEFSENTNFVYKFRVEAQAAAGLMHPNIVNVYDVGEENGIYFIVMELVEGITLKKYIEKKARLSVKEAISIAIQVSMGIEAAHNNNIIHRDIKPQNIIISKDGKVKVTDFGIAKAATSNTITSNVMGSVHYTSPEQARGGYSDERSDIYSLGITMFEMLTGRVPFNGETTVAIAIKHIQEEMQSPRYFVPEIPVSVEQIVFKCTQKSPDRRYQSINELIADLKKSLINPDEDFVKVVDFSNQEATKMISENDIAQIKKQSDRRDTIEKEPANKTSAKKPQSAKQSKESRRRPEEEDTEEDNDDEFDPKMEKVTTVLTIVVAIIIGCILLFLAGRAVGLFSGEAKVEKDRVETTGQEGPAMPEVIGKSLAEAQSEMKAAGLESKVEYAVSADYDKNTVIDCNVKAGTLMKKGDEATLTVSAGKNGVKVPNVTGLSLAEATAMLNKEGLDPKKVTAASAEVAKGNIISQSPVSGTIVDRDTSVTITVSEGKENEKIQVPEVRGMNESAAKVALTAAGFVCTKVTQEQNAEYDVGAVCYQSYSAGSYQDPGTDVELRISLGVSYSCNVSVNAPADYQGGDATITLTAADTGEVLFTSSTSTFPFALNKNGIHTTDTGIITITYTIPVDPPVTNADGSVTNSKVVTTEQPVQFTKE